MLLFGFPKGLEVENNLRSLTINEAFPWKEICERFKDDIPERFLAMQRYIEESKPHHVKPHFLFRLRKIIFHEYDAFNFVLLLVVICIIQRLFSRQIPFILLEVFVNLFVVLTL